MANSPLLLLARPGAGQIVQVPVGPNARLELGFDTSSASVGRNGQHLVMSFEDGGALTLNNFYNHFGAGANGASATPPTLIVEGQDLPGTAFLAALNNPDLMPAAGPDTPSLLRGGGGRGDDALLGGVDGVDGFDKFGFDGWARSTDAPAQAMRPLPPVIAPIAADDMPPPALESPYQARGVLYNITDYRVRQPTLTVDLLDAADPSKAAGAGAPAPLLAFVDASGAPIPDPFGTVTYAGGKIFFSNPMESEGIYYCLVTDGGGKSYTMQLVVRPDGFFDSAAQDAADGAKLVHGEWHAGGLYWVGRGPAYSISSSGDYGDILDFGTSAWAGADSRNETGMTGATINTGAGNDVISIAVPANSFGSTCVERTTINTGDGDDIINVTCRLSSDAMMTALDSCDINMGNGNDTFVVENTSMYRTALDMGDGNNTVKASYAFNSTINAGNGDDYVAVAYLSNGAINTGGGDDVVTGVGSCLNSAINMGDGDDLLFFTSNSTNSPNARNSTLDGGANDAIVQAHADGSLAHLGDILGMHDMIRYTYQATSPSAFVTGGNTFEHFETLLVDMLASSTRTLDSLLDNFHDFRVANGADYVQGGLVITGNGTDAVTGFGASAALHQNVGVAGISGNFDHFVVNDGYGHDLDLYIQHEIARLV